jgi:hypothetical protein
LIEKGDHIEAELHLNQAVQAARQLGSVSLQLRAVIEIGRRWSSRGRLDDARELIRPVYQTIDHECETSGLKSARAILFNDQRTAG